MKYADSFAEVTAKAQHAWQITILISDGTDGALSPPILMTVIVGFKLLVFIDILLDASSHLKVHISRVSISHKLFFLLQGHI